MLSIDAKSKQYSPPISHTVARLRDATGLSYLQLTLSPFVDVMMNLLPCLWNRTSCRLNVNCRPGGTASLWTALPKMFVVKGSWMTMSVFKKQNVPGIRMLSCFKPMIR